MRLAVISHKLVWKSNASPSGFATDGGFPFQMEALSELFDSTTLIVPCSADEGVPGTAPLNGDELSVLPLPPLKGRGFRRKAAVPFWLLRNVRKIWKEIGRADAVHAPIPGDVGTIGMMLALLRRKPLFVRHCGNWFVQRTLAEHFWRWSMEYVAGGRNVMLATGGASEAPSPLNANVKWIFSTSMRRHQISKNKARSLPEDGKIRLAIACRQEARKGTDVVIESMPAILRSFPNATLDVIGDGSKLDELKARAKELGLDDAVCFHGKVQHSSVLEFLGSAHIFCFPTDASEGFPKVVLEAMAHGVPVVTTPVSVLPELLRDGGGILLDRPDPAQLAGAITKLCSEPELYGQVSSNSLETSRKYSIESWQERIGEILKDSWNVGSLKSDRPESSNQR